MLKEIDAIDSKLRCILTSGLKNLILQFQRANMTIKSCLNCNISLNNSSNSYNSIDIEEKQEATKAKKEILPGEEPREVFSMALELTKELLDNDQLKIGITRSDEPNIQLTKSNVLPPVQEYTSPLCASPLAFSFFSINCLIRIFSPRYFIPTIFVTSIDALGTLTIVFVGL